MFKESHRNDLNIHTKKMERCDKIKESWQKNREK